MFIHRCRSCKSVICVASSTSVDDAGGFGSEIEAAERCAGREESDVRKLVGLRVDPRALCGMGPVYATGLGERDAVRKERYWPTLGT
jgi:hypothetical protein